jgi:hypothetical protein
MNPHKKNKDYNYNWLQIALAPLFRIICKWVNKIKNQLSHDVINYERKYFVEVKNSSKKRIMSYIH